jgi:hypothetical protein
MRWKSSPYGKDALPIALDIYERIASLYAVDQAGLLGDLALVARGQLSYPADGLVGYGKMMLRSEFGSLLKAE